MPMLVDRRHPIVDGDLLLRWGLCFAMVAVLLLVGTWSSIGARGFPDPDDTLRLIQVRDLIAGQGWFDVTQYRVDAPGGGVPMHWSRLVDIPLAATILALTPLIGQSQAEGAAIVAIPLLTFGIAIFLAGRIAWRLLGDEATGFACLALALSVPVLVQMRPLRIDHHGWQIVFALLAMNGLMARDPRRGGWVIGGALAMSLAISIEGLPLAAAIMGVLALRWLRDRREAVCLISAMQVLAVGSAALFFATRGIADLVNHCDAVSPVHLAIFAWGALALTGLGALGPHPRAFIIGGFAIAGTGAVAILGVVAPQCAGGAFSDMDPIVRTYWYQSIAEGLPVWRQSLSGALQMVVPALVGLGAAIQLARTSHGWLGRFWSEYAMILFAALLVALFVSRASAVAGAIAAAPLGWQIREWIRAARMMRRPSKRVLTLAGVALALMPAMPVTLLGMAAPAQASIGPEPEKVSSCDIAGSARALRNIPTGEIFAPMDISPRILFETDHSVVATSHHRGQKSMRFAIETFIGSPEQARRALTARGTDYVALCPDLGEPRVYMAAAPEGFAAKLVEGEQFDWLQPVDTGVEGGMRVWRVIG